MMHACFLLCAMACTLAQSYLYYGLQDQHAHPCSGLQAHTLPCCSCMTSLQNPPAC